MIKAKTAADFSIYAHGVARRWNLQRHAQGLLSDKIQKETKNGTVNAFEYRVAMCMRGTDGGAPVVKRSKDFMSARFAGLQTCGSVWHCPICAPKVVAERRDEMNEAIAAWVGGGGAMYFVTYTMQHDAESYGQGKLTLQLDHLATAHSKVKSSRAYKQTMAAAGYKGAIKALECTYGEINGWHAHSHELIFAGADHLRTLQKLRATWARLLIKRGHAGLKAGDIGVDKFRKLRALLRHCLTVQPGEYAAEYVAKFGKEPENERGGQWGLASEMTRSHMKKGFGSSDAVPQRCLHATPWALLNDSLDGDKRSGLLFREFAQSFQGKRQLFWSRGLKEFFFGTVGRSDEEIAADSDKRCTEFVCEIQPSQWADVIAHNARYEILKVAAHRGAEGVMELLARLREAPRTHGEHFTELNPVLYEVPGFGNQLIGATR